MKPVSRFAALRALLRVQARNSWRGYMGRRGKSLLSPFLLLLLIPAFLPLLLMLYGASLGFYLAGQQMGQPQVVLTAAFAVGQLTALSFGVLYVLSSFFFARDLKLLTPLPLRAGDIVLAKFVGILSGEYLTTAPVVLPALWVYGSMTGAGAFYWSAALLLFLLMPVPALVVSAVFSLLLMRVTRGRRSRDLVRVLGAALGLTFAAAIQLVKRFDMSGTGPGRGLTGQQAAAELLRRQGGLVDQVGRFMPTSIWATEALRLGPQAQGILYLALFVVTAVAALALLLWAAERFFFGGLVGGDEVRSSGRALTADELTVATATVRSPSMALLRREMWLLNRNPSFVIAAWVPPLIVPVFMLIPLLGTGELQDITGRAQAGAGSPLAPLIAMAAAVFMHTLSNVAPVAVSREGRYFWISRVIPVRPRLQVQAKVLHSLMFALLPLAVVLAALAYLGLLGPANLAYVVLGVLFGAVATSCAGLMVDLIHPRLTWNDPQEAMKGNINTLFGMVLTMVVLGAGALAAVAGWFLVAPAAAPLAVLAVMAVLAGGLYLGLDSLAERRYGEIAD